MTQAPNAQCLEKSSYLLFIIKEVLQVIRARGPPLLEKSKFITNKERQGQQAVNFEEQATKS